MKEAARPSANQDGPGEGVLGREAHSPLRYLSLSSPGSFSSFHFQIRGRKGKLFCLSCSVLKPWGKGQAGRATRSGPGTVGEARSLALWPPGQGGSLRLSVQGRSPDGVVCWALRAQCPACECVSPPGAPSDPGEGPRPVRILRPWELCPRGPHGVGLAVCGWQASPAGLPQLHEAAWRGRGASPTDRTRQERLRVPAPLTCGGPSGSQGRERSWWRRRNRPDSGPKREVKPSAFSSPLPQFTSPENRPGRTEQGWLPSGGRGGGVTDNRIPSPLALCQNYFRYPETGASGWWVRDGALRGLHPAQGGLVSGIWPSPGMSRVTSSRSRGA